MPTDLPEPTPSHTRTLESLLEDIRRAREDVSASRCGPVVPERLLSARQSLLRAMEAYAQELTARNLPIPWKLHGELRLQREVRRSSTASP